MKALVYHDTRSVKVETVDDPKIIDPTDAIIKITSTAICGSDLHIYNGFVMGMKEGDILGHEFMGEVVETGSNIKKLKIGDRIVVPFNISCGVCHFCKQKLFSLCDMTNPDTKKLEELHGFAGAGMYGYSHLYGGFAGGQAEYVRVINADVNHLKIPNDIEDEKVLFLTDIFPTGYMAAENAQIKKGDTVAIWGCGPVGQFAIRSAFLLGAENVIAIDRFEERLKMANDAGAETINYENEEDVVEKIKTLTKGRGPNSCIDAVGLEAHGDGLGYLYDKAKQIVMLQTDRPTALRQVIQACGKGGTVSIPGVYFGIVDKFNIGSAFGKGLTLKMGQTHVQRYLEPLFELIRSNKIDPSFVITDTMNLKEAEKGYEKFAEKNDGCIKIVLKP